MKEFYASLKLNRNYFKDVSIHFVHNVDVVPLNSNPEIWSSYFHNKYGLCHMIDSSKYEVFNFKENKHNLRLDITFDHNVPYEWAYIMLHTPNDTSDAYDSQPIEFIETKIPRYDF